MAKLKILADEILALSGKELIELCNIFENDYGIKPLAPAPMMMPVAAAVASEAAPEKTTLDLVVKSAGTSKLAVVKLIKEITGLSLKEAKDFIDSVPATMKESLPKEEAESIKRQLEAAGAEVELK